MGAEAIQRRLQASTRGRVREPAAQIIATGKGQRKIRAPSSALKVVNSFLQTGNARHPWSSTSSR